MIDKDAGYKEKLKAIEGLHRLKACYSASGGWCYPGAMEMIYPARLLEGITA